MKKAIRCKVCGYVGDEKEMKGLCPACAAPATAFEPAEQPKDVKRETLLRMHLHPVTVHFPQAFALSALALAVAALAPGGELREKLSLSIALVSFALPLTGLAGVISGLFDARLRFKNKFGPRVKIKIVLGTVFLTASIAAAVLVNFETGDTADITALLLYLVCLVCSVLLGMKGSTLLGAKRP